MKEFTVEVYIIATNVSNVVVKACDEESAALKAIEEFKCGNAQPDGGNETTTYEISQIVEEKRAGN